jgi:hypothetical protein
MAFTNDMSAHTSYLFIVKDQFVPDRISQISPAQKMLRRLPFGVRRTG